MQAASSFEFRWGRMNAKPSDMVAIYENHPTKQVTGHFIISPASVFGIPVESALWLEKAGAARRDLAVYLTGAKKLPR